MIGADWIGFLFPALIGLVWLLLEARLHCKLARIKKTLTAMDRKKT